MNATERAARRRDFEGHSHRELVDVILQAEEAIEVRNERLRNARKAERERAARLVESICSMTAHCTSCECDHATIAKAIRRGVS